AAIAEALARVAPRGPDLRSARMDAAEAWEHAGDPAAALKYLDALLQQKADDTEVVERLDGLAGRHDLWAEVCGLYENSHARDLPPALAADRAYHIASLHRDRLTDEASAARWFESMLAAPTDIPGDSQDEAFRFLSSYYKASDDPESQARILQRWLDSLEPTSEEREGLRSQLAAVLMDQLERPDEALSLLEEDLQHVLSDDALLERAETLYRQTERFGPLVQLLDLGISQAEISDARRTTLLQRKLSVAEEGLGDAAIIREATDALLELNPHHAQALDARENLAVRKEDWSTLGDTLGVRVELAERLEDRIALLLRRAELAQEHLSQPELAISCAEEVHKVLSADAEERPQLVALLERLLKGGEAVGIAAAELLEVHYRLDERWDDYEHVLRVRLDATPVAGDRVDTALLLAQTQENQLDASTRALETLIGEIRYGGDPASYRGETQRLAEETATWGELADALEGRLNAADADTSVIQLVSPWLAEITRERLQQTARACRALERGLEVSPSDLDLLEAIAPLYNETGEWHALQRIYGLQVDAQDEADRVHTWRKLALLNETELHDLGGAREAWTRLLDAEPDDG
ncbi:MAG: hypothetical protein VX938_05910, partial [Myxococcota bacterium]|nr:hypothetical protein [Myxococcota bacterium]